MIYAEALFLARGLGGFGVPEEKTVDNCFFKEVTETRKNEVRLCRTRVLTMFQEVENGKSEQKFK